MMLLLLALGLFVAAGYLLLDTAGPREDAISCLIIALIMLSATAAFLAGVCMTKDHAVKKGAAEYYLDSYHEKRFRRTPAQPKEDSK